MRKNYNTFNCDVCGRFIPFKDMLDEVATHRLITPDAYGTDGEEYETLCKLHTDPNMEKMPI